MEKLKYEKPVSVNGGQVASGADTPCDPYGGTALDYCTDGYTAGGPGCTEGTNPSLINTCPSGTVADSNCYPAGGTAFQSCNAGSQAGWGSTCTPTGSLVM